MNTYKPKLRYYFINSCKQPQYIFNDNYVLLNLSSIFIKSDNFSKLDFLLKEIRPITSVVNLCNLASLCFKFNMQYASKDTLNFAKKIVDICKENNMQIIQNNIFNHGEVDMKPISTLVYWDRQRDIIFCNSILMDTLKKLGYADNQLFDILDFSTDFNKILPDDLIQSLPIQSKASLGCYNMILDYIKEGV